MTKENGRPRSERREQGGIFGPRRFFRFQNLPCKDCWVAQKATQTSGSHMMVPGPNKGGYRRSCFVGSLCLCGCLGPNLMNKFSRCFAGYQAKMVRNILIVWSGVSLKVPCRDMGVFKNGGPGPEYTADATELEYDPPLIPKQSKEVKQRRHTSINHPKSISQLLGAYCIRTPTKRSPNLEKQPYGTINIDNLELPKIRGT